MKKLSLLFLLMVSNVAICAEKETSRFNRLTADEWHYITKKSPNLHAALTIDSTEGRDAAIEFLKENGCVLPKPSELSDIRLQDEMRWQAFIDKRLKEAEAEIAKEVPCEENFIRRFRAITGSTSQGPLEGRDQFGKKLTETNVFYEYRRYIKHFPPAGEHEEIELIKKIIAEFKKEDKEFLENLTKEVETVDIQKAYLENS